jgi:hypothetical protein
MHVGIRWGNFKRKEITKTILFFITEGPEVQPTGLINVHSKIFRSWLQGYYWSFPSHWDSLLTRWKLSISSGKPPDKLGCRPQFGRAPLCTPHTEVCAPMHASNRGVCRSRTPLAWVWAGPTFASEACAAVHASNQVVHSCAGPAWGVAGCPHLKEGLRGPARLRLRRAQVRTPWRRRAQVRTPWRRRAFSQPLSNMNNLKT